MNRKQRHQRAMEWSRWLPVAAALIPNACWAILGRKQFRRLLRRKRERIGEYAK